MEANHQLKLSPVEIFRHVLEEESRAVARILERLDPDPPTQAISVITACRGKVIVLGVGKSGLIGRKIAATLSSTGTTAAFLHASDAVHGDLGLLSPEDVVVMLSNSGESDELVVLLPHIRRRQVPIIAITGNPGSSLARQATVVLDARVEREACPLNLAPTASTTAALAVGDALAIAVAHNKGLTADDFAFNHPSGRLGKRLTLRVSDLMHQGAENPTVAPEASTVEVILALSSFRLGALNVINQDRDLVGVITEGDLRRALGRSEPAQWVQLRAEEIMSRRPTTVSADSLAYDALKLMEDRPSQISVLPVVEPPWRCIGMIRLHDLVRARL